MNDLSHFPTNDLSQPDALASAEQAIVALKTWRTHIEKALHHGGEAHAFDDIVRMVLQGRVHFYAFGDCFIIMEIVSYPKFKVYHGFLSGGDLQSILKREDMMSSIGKALGCQYLSIAGRHGWKRVFESRGWKFICVTMYKELQP